jgi:hypothetical protein
MHRSSAGELGKHLAVSDQIAVHVCACCGHRHRHGGSGARQGLPHTAVSEPDPEQPRQLVVGEGDCPRAGPRLRAVPLAGARSAAAYPHRAVDARVHDGIGPCTGDQTAVPAQHRVRFDDEAGPAGRGSMRLIAVSRARSAGSSLGRGTWRRRTVSWWRSTRISRSLAASPRLYRVSSWMVRHSVRWASFSSTGVGLRGGGRGGTLGAASQHRGGRWCEPAAHRACRNFRIPRGPGRACQGARRGLRHPPGAVRPQAPSTAGAAHRRVDQPAKGGNAQHNEPLINLSHRG